MPDRSTLTLFVTASLVLLITPGPAVLYIVTRSIDQGRLAGLMSALGANIGILVYAAAAALGVSALLAASPIALGIIRCLGAAYLLYLGLRRLAGKPAPARPADGLAAGGAAPPAATPAAGPGPRRMEQVFREGIVVNLLNPKLALFFLAFLPQFVDPRRGPAAPQGLLLGGLFALMALCSDSVYALLSGTAGRLLRGSRAFLLAQRWVVGGLYLALGLLAVLSGTLRGAG